MTEISQTEAAYWRDLAESLAGMLPRDVVLAMVERKIKARVTNAATAERLRARMGMLVREVL